MKAVRFAEYLKSNDLAVLDGARWLLIKHDELINAGTIIFHSELLDILVAVDNRGAKIPDGLWQRAVHLILADSSYESETEAEICRRTCINKVIFDAEGPLISYCW